MTVLHEPAPDAVRALFAAVGRTARLVGAALAGLPAVLARRDGRRTLARQLFIVGVGTLAVATVVALFTDAGRAATLCANTVDAAPL